MTLPVEHSVLTTLSAAVAGGTFLTILARKFDLPSIILLLLGGVILGPEALGIVEPEKLGDFLPVLVSLAVGIILFEGALTLDLRGFQLGSGTIVRLLSVGVLATWLGAALCVWLVLQTSLSLALLAGSLVIVTGPTVIGPLLKKININPRLHSILHWEGVLIDAIGVFVAILCFEWVAGQNGGQAVASFLLRILSGLTVGFLGGFGILHVLRRRLVPANLLNAFTLASAVLIFGLTESLITEGGLLAVTLAGFIVGWKRPDDLKQIRAFKADITELLIGLLFILLTARLELEQFTSFGLAGALAVVLVLVVVRPLNVLASTWGTDLSLRERVFLSWVAPRGIVAASMASLFALALGESTRIGDSRLLETFTYSVIAASVILQGLTAGWLARLLGLKRPDPTGWLIVSANQFSRQIARFIQQKAECEVVLLDTNARVAREARREGFTVLGEDALQVEMLEERVEIQSMGNLLALTDNPELNTLLCQRWSEVFGTETVYRWSVLNQRQQMAGRVQGIPVYAQLPKPSVLSSELAAGDARLIVEPSGVEMDGFPLAGIRAKSVLLPVRGRESEFRTESMDWVLRMQREGSSLLRSLARGGAMDVDAKTLDQLYEAMIDLAVRRHPDLSKGDTLRELRDKDRMVPGLLGHGIAIPHVYSTHLARRVCVLARVVEGIPVPDDSDPLRLAFFLISPSGDPEGHLNALAEIARVCEDEAHRVQLRDAESAEDALRLVRRFVQI